MTNSVQYESQVRSVEDWMNQIDSARTMLPQFQRMEAWDRKKVAKLFDSIFQGIPIGSLLLLKANNNPPFAYRPINSAPSLDDRSDSLLEEMVLDGQQRLTALWKALHDSYRSEDGTGPTFFVQRRRGSKGRWKETPESDLPIVRVMKMHTRANREGLYPRWARHNDKENWEEIFKRGLIPLSFFNPLTDNSELEDWVREFCGFVEKDQIGYLQQLNDRFSNQIERFDIPYIALQDASPEIILETFVRTNTQAVQLKPFDLVVARAQLDDVDLHDKVNKLFEEVPELEDQFGMDPESPSDDADFLRATVISKKKIPTQTKVLNLTGSYLERIWDDMIEATQATIQFLYDNKIFDMKRMPVGSMFPQLIALFMESVDSHNLRRGNAESILTRYMWSSFLFGRYSQSTNQKIQKDFEYLNSVLTNGESLDLPWAKEDDIPDTEEFLQARWPKYKERLSRTVLLASLQKGAKDIYTGKEISESTISSREYHHIFPEAYLQERGYDDDMINSPLNCILITQQANREISATRPKSYFNEIDNESVDSIAERLKTHLIPVKPFHNENYEEFLEQRAELIKKDICDRSYIKK